jgi:tetratricopeptide (TPR) repeat protein
MKKLIVLLIISCVLGCTDIAVSFTDKKKPVFTQSDLAKDANTYFWDNFHAGNYDSIPEIIEKLNMALAENPNDLVTTDHLGFVHVWALSERQRLQAADPLIVDHVYLSRRFFEEAYNMNEDDPRILGFFTDLSLAEGASLNNKREQTEAYFMGLKCIKQWPQFNKFTVGYAFSNLPPGDKNFKQGLKWQYESMDDCACEVTDPSKLSYQQKTEVIRTSKTAKVKRACGDSWIAPHNLEGFFLNFGDMLVKNGQWQEAIKIYELAKIPDNFNKWIYKDTLENRIKNAQENTVLFNKLLNEADLRNQTVMMVNSRFSCTGCHGMSKEEQILFGKQEPSLRYYFLKDKLKSGLPN